MQPPVTKITFPFREGMSLSGLKSRNPAILLAFMMSLEGITTSEDKKMMEFLKGKA